VVVQSDAFLPRSTVIVAPTSTSARPASFRPEIDIGGTTTRVLIEQLGAVDTSRLGDLVDHVDGQQLWGVDDALATVLDLR
jgi:mRNA interferase MazF